MRPWLAIALGVGVVVLIALVFPLVQSQRHLTNVRAELGRTNEQLVQATRTILNFKAEFESAQSQLKDSKDQTQELTAKLDKARGGGSKSKPSRCPWRSSR
jgi:chromosome segregation ATPase